jgi:hypothetical protein
LEFVAYKDRKAVAAALKEIYRAVDATAAAIHTVLTDNGMAFADLPEYRDGPTAT